MENNNNALLLQQIANMRQSFFDEGMLDSYFVQLEQLEGPDDPEFVEEIFNLFFKDSTNMFDAMEQKMDMNPPDFVGIEKILHQMKASTGSLGTIRLKEKVVSMRICIRARNLPGARQEFRLLKDEYNMVHTKLQAYFQLIARAGGAEAVMMAPGSPSSSSE